MDERCAAVFRDVEMEEVKLYREKDGIPLDPMNPDAGNLDEAAKSENLGMDRYASDIRSDESYGTDESCELGGVADEELDDPDLPVRIMSRYVHDRPFQHVDQCTCVSLLQVRTLLEDSINWHGRLCWYKTRKLFYKNVADLAPPGYQRKSGGTQKFIWDANSAASCKRVNTKLREYFIEMFNDSMTRTSVTIGQTNSMSAADDVIKTLMFCRNIKNLSICCDLNTSHYDYKQTLRFERLTAFTLQACNDTDELLVWVLGATRRLTSFRLRGTPNISGTFFHRLLPSAFTNLEELEITGSMSFSNEAIRTIVTTASTRLKTLKVFNMKILGKNLCNAIFSCHNLADLFLKFKAYESIDELAKLNNLGKLEKVVLGFVDNTVLDQDEIGSVVWRNLQPLRELELILAPCEDITHSKIKTIMDGAPNLTKLQLTINHPLDSLEVLLLPLKYRNLESCKYILCRRGVPFLNYRELIRKFPDFGKRSLVARTVFTTSLYYRETYEFETQEPLAWFEFLFEKETPTVDITDEILTEILGQSDIRIYETAV